MTQKEAQEKIETLKANQEYTKDYNERLSIQYEINRLENAKLKD